MSKIRRFIINWLFKYPLPEYFHAIEYMKNIKWDRVNNDEYCTEKYKRIVGDIVLMRSEWKNNSMKPYYAFHGNNQRTGSIEDYGEMIIELDYILRYGIIKP